MTRPPKYKRQRIRDPLHNIIEFEDDQFEDAIWRALQTRPFQRLRRIKQLGFSELVFPGATHTRFAHSVGVFHTARRLMSVIQRHLGQQDFQATRAHQALAAALLHDLGHGPFSHAFEKVGDELGLKLAHHEAMSDCLIRSDEIRHCLRSLGQGFADDVADMIRKDGPASIYTAVVASQFDADRLDYIRRDRLMTGTQHGAIDFDWLMSNLEVGHVGLGVDETELGEVETFVLGPKANHAAETFVLGLFQLYPTVYFHKTTRGAEAIFAELLLRLINLTRDGSASDTGLAPNHPVITFAQDAENPERLLALDDTVVWGSLAMMQDGSDSLVSGLARRLQDRRLFKCIDLREEFRRLADPMSLTSEMLNRHCAAVLETLEAWKSELPDRRSRILIDGASRPPYKRLQETTSPLDQIMIRKANGGLVDLAETSTVVNAIQTFRLDRLYVAPEDDEASRVIRSEIQSELRHVRRA